MFIIQPHKLTLFIKVKYVFFNGVFTRCLEGHAHINDELRTCTCASVHIRWHMCIYSVLLSFRGHRAVCHERYILHNTRRHV